MQLVLFVAYIKFIMLFTLVQFVGVHLTSSIGVLLVVN